MNGIPRRFKLVRVEDESGISGVGDVAFGVEFADGVSVIRWSTKHRSTAIYNSIMEIEKIHGHDGKTVVVWLDKDPS
jgi:hypothetical protein